jgi:hypothetical protein
MLCLVPIPIVFANTLNDCAMLLLQSGAQYLSAFSPAQLDALTYVFMRVHGMGFQVAGIFWGLWLFPLGSLVMRSGFIPRILGYSVWIGGAGYLLESFITLVMPRLTDSLLGVADTMTLGELPIILWLLIMGARGGCANEVLADAQRIDA